MRRLPTLFLALLLAASPLMAEAGVHGHDHHGHAGHAPAGHAAGDLAPAHHHDSAATSADEDCENAAPDHCCGDTGVACHATYLPGGVPGGAALTVVSARLLLGRGNGPDSLHPESDPPPPRA
jgi:hypothetical protein